MSYFKQHNKDKKRPKTIDGFMPRQSSSLGDRSDVQSRFRTAYNPQTSHREMRASTEGFISRQGQVTYDNQEAMKSIDDMVGSVAFEAAADQQQTHSKRHRWNRRDKSYMSRKEKHHRSNFKKSLRAFAVLTIALVIGVASLFTYGYIKARNIFRGDGEGAAALQENVDPARLNGEGDGRVNILLIGKGGPGHEAPDLTDTVLLASIDPVQNETALVSVPRDTYVKDSKGYSTKINAIYSAAKQARLARSNQNDSDKQAAEDAGLKALEESVTDVLGIPVHYYVMIDFVAFEEAINTVGGVTVDVQEPLYDQSVAWLLDGNPLIADKGLQTFNGERALLYARSRKGSARGDFDRTERQREIIVALQKKVLSIGTFSNPFKVVELMSNLGDRVRTDLNGLEEIKRLYEIGQEISEDKIISIGLADPPNILMVTDNINGQSVVVPRAGLYQYDEIRSYIRNTIRDPFLKQEEARVLILNGTTVAGLASATSEELKSYGYNVIGVDNAPTSDYTSNLLIDTSKGEKRYTKSYIEKRLGLTAQNNIPPGVPGQETADFVIILGTDEVLKTAN